MKKIGPVFLAVVLLFVFCSSALADVVIPSKLPAYMLLSSSKLYKTDSTKSGSVKSLKSNTAVQIIGQTRSYYRVVCGNSAGYLPKKVFQPKSKYSPIGFFNYAERKIYCNPDYSSQLRYSFIYIYGIIDYTYTASNYCLANVFCADGYWRVYFPSQAIMASYPKNEPVVITGIFDDYAPELDMPLMSAGDDQFAQILQESFLEEDLFNDIPIPSELPKYVMPKGAKLLKSVSSRSSKTINQEAEPENISLSAPYQYIPPKTSSATTLKQGATVEVIGKTGSYYKVVYGNSVGYLPKTLFDPTGNYPPIGSFVHADHKTFSIPSHINILSFSLIYIHGTIYDEFDDNGNILALVRSEDGDWAVFFPDQAARASFQRNVPVTITGVYLGYDTGNNIPCMYMSSAEDASYVQQYLAEHN